MAWLDTARVDSSRNSSHSEFFRSGVPSMSRLNRISVAMKRLNPGSVQVLQRKFNAFQENGPACLAVDHLDVFRICRPSKWTICNCIPDTSKAFKRPGTGRSGLDDFGRRVTCPAHVCRGALLGHLGSRTTVVLERFTGETALRNGVFVIATEDRCRRILGDGGINAVVPADFWNEVL